ncbi:MAG: ABC transporter ATP-binding protein [Salinirussus sp.]
MSAIQLDGITKRFGDVTALNDLDLRVERGEVFGFLGPNGAGKSTTIDVMLGYIRATAGSGEVLGYDVEANSVAIRERTGILPDRFGPIDSMTGRRQVEFAIQSKNAEDSAAELLERVGMLNAAERPVAEYSTGMAQRLMLAMALSGKPELLILDEPTTGLDPNGARRMREIITEEQERGATVFFSSHILEQVEAVADRVGIIQNGEMIAVDSIDGLRSSPGQAGYLELVITGRIEGLVEELKSIGGVSAITRQDSSLRITCTDAAKAAVVHRAHERTTVENVRSVDRSLEDLFVAYTEAEN